MSEIEGIKIRHPAKYAGMTEDEIAKMRYIRQVQWYKNLTDEEREAYKNKVKARNKENPERRRGVCEICGKEYGNIYQHRNTKKHLEKLNKK